MRSFFVVSAAMLALLSGGAAAHHGWGSYDTSRKMTIEGPVKHVQWQNPHAHIRVDHEGKEWEIVLAPISRMQLRGISPDMLAHGTMIAAEGYPSKRVENEMRAERIKINGKTFEMR
ncbi:MAG: DUF6152 family protein [Aestuariivirgaceae bacterium]